MKYFRLFNAILILSLGFTSCKDPKTVDEKRFSFKNDFEGIDGWYAPNGIIRADSHSGSFAGFANFPQEYGPTFRKRIKDLSKKPLKRIEYSCWIKLNESKCNPEIVLNIMGKDNAFLFFKSYPVKDFPNEKGEWFEIKGSELIAPEASSSNDAEVAFFLWNKSSLQAFIDDIEIVLIY